MHPRVTQPTRPHVDAPTIFRLGLLLLGAFFVARLFYLQIIRHDYYREKALTEHLNKFEVPAERGVIEFLDGASAVPVVLNERRYLLYADPKIVERPEEAARQLSPIVGVEESLLRERLTKKSRYEVLARRLNKATFEKVQQLDIQGLGLKATSERTYPQGALAAQLLGFVNDEGNGQYGVEEFLNGELRGKPGVLKAITDNSSDHVPLATQNENILVQPEQGKHAVLSVDVGMQRLAEEALQSGIDASKAKRGSVLIMEAQTGRVKAMANLPSYQPADYRTVEDLSLFQNSVTSSPLEVGSIMKTLTVATALDRGVIGREDTYFDPNTITVDGKVIKNALNYGAAQRTTTEMLQKSLNTGMVELLMRLGRGAITEEARQIIYKYDTEHYRLGQLTGIEQAGEAEGIVQLPNEGDGLNIRYANMVFGQGITATLIQMGAAMSAAVNGGTYYQPTLLYGYRANDGTVAPTEPIVVRQNVISSVASSDLRILMERVVEANNKPAVRPGFSVGGKTGTAQIPDGQGGYREDAYIGTYIGFVGGETPEYVVVVRMDEPGIPGFAGTVAAAPVFASISNGLINIHGVTPRE